MWGGLRSFRLLRGNAEIAGKHRWAPLALLLGRGSSSVSAMQQSSLLKAPLPADASDEDIAVWLFLSANADDILSTFAE